MRRLGMSLLTALAVSWLVQVALGSFSHGADRYFPLDTGSLPPLVNQEKLLSDQAKLIIFGSWRLSSTQKPKIIILGASGAQEAYRPQEIACLARGYEVHNLCIGASNITQLDEILDHVLISTPPEVLKRSILVVGVIYSLFTPDSIRWRAGDYEKVILNPQDIATDIYREELRCRLLFRTLRRAPSLLPYWAVNALKNYYWSILPQDLRLPAHLADPIIARMALPAPAASKKKPKKSGPPSHYNAFDSAIRKVGVSGTQLPEEQFAKLASMLRKAAGHGLRPVVVNMPLPSMHLARLPYLQSYHHLLDLYLGPLVQAGLIQYMELQDDAPDAEFRDTAHPVEAATVRWAQTLVERMNLRPAAPPPAGNAPAGT